MSNFPVVRVERVDVRNESVSKIDVWARIKNDSDRQVKVVSWEYLGSMRNESHTLITMTPSGIGHQIGWSSSAWTAVTSMAATPRIFYTDGSASPNPGPGGYAVIEQGKPVALGSEPGNTTNIRMEGMALIAAMQLAGAEECEIHTDSEFWVNALTKWAPGWAAKGWRKSSGPIKNLELVQEAYALYTTVQPKLIWVRGHNGARAGERLEEK